MRSPDDTIVALSTPAGRGAIALVRLSGPDALDVANKVFTSSRPCRDGRARLGAISSASTGEEIDTGYMTFFSSRRSYTGQDVVELSCHGSPVIVGRILEELAGAGARPADPGEFTYRAVLNGRMDLAQAEGVRDLIEAATRTAAAAASTQIKGHLSRRVNDLRERLVEMVCRAEAAVEFAEEPDVESRPYGLQAEAERLAADLSAFASTYRLGRRLTEGATVVIAGRPNAGKSSLFNVLLDAPRAIVSHEPGTTRDYISEAVDLGGIPVTLVDTAGLRESPGPAEEEGVRRAREWAGRADLVLVLCPLAEPIHAEDEALIAACGGRALLVGAKSDLPARVWGARSAAAEVSSMTRAGVDALRGIITERLAGTAGLAHEAILVTNARHHAALESCAAQVSQGVMALRDGMTEEVALSYLHQGLRQLAEITEPVTRDEIHDRIFSTFCIGK
ncbi:MAG: tRNA uridine-5-carboxymethylaminomethyl(34) synthesis GTPase MnmE [Candidatus Polarisedimenticolia bacterium]